MNNDLNISGRKVEKIISILKYIVIQFKKRNNNEILSTVRILPGEIPMLPNDKFYVDNNNYYIEHLYNFTDENNNPYLLKEEFNGKTYFVNCLKIDVSKSFPEIYLKQNNQEVHKYLQIISDERVYVTIVSDDNHNFTTSLYQINDYNGRKKQLFSLQTDTACQPGEIYEVPVTIIIYKDSEYKNKIGECSTKVKVVHESMTTPD